jgi:hypothetical protein
MDRGSDLDSRGLEAEQNEAEVAGRQSAESRRDQARFQSGSPSRLQNGSGHHRGWHDGAGAVLRRAHPTHREKQASARSRRIGDLGLWKSAGSKAALIPSAQDRQHGPRHAFPRGRDLAPITKSCNARNPPGAQHRWWHPIWRFPMWKQIPVVVAAGLIIAPTIALARASSPATPLRPVALSSSYRATPTISAHLTRLPPTDVSSRRRFGPGGGR